MPKFVHVKATFDQCSQRELGDSTGLSMTELTGEALKIYEEAVRQAAAGRTLAFINEDGTVAIKIKVPGLVTAKARASMKKSV